MGRRQGAKLWICRECRRTMTELEVYYQGTTCTCGGRLELVPS